MVDVETWWKVGFASLKRHLCVYNRNDLHRIFAGRSPAQLARRRLQCCSPLSPIVGRVAPNPPRAGGQNRFGCNLSGIFAHDNCRIDGHVPSLPTLNLGLGICSPCSSDSRVDYFVFPAVDTAFSFPWPCPICHLLRYKCLQLLFGLCMHWPPPFPVYALESRWNRTSFLLQDLAAHGNVSIPPAGSLALILPQGCQKNYLRVDQESSMHFVW